MTPSQAFSVIAPIIESFAAKYQFSGPDTDFMLFLIYKALMECPS